MLYLLLHRSTIITNEITECNQGLNTNQRFITLQMFQNDSDEQPITDEIKQASIKGSHE